MSKRRYRTPEMIDMRTWEFGYEVLADFQTNPYDLPGYARLNAALIVVARILLEEKKTTLDIVGDIDNYIETIKEEMENE